MKKRKNKSIILSRVIDWRGKVETLGFWSLLPLLSECLPGC